MSLPDMTQRGLWYSAAVFLLLLANAGLMAYRLYHPVSLGQSVGIAYLQNALRWGMVAVVIGGMAWVGWARDSQ